MGENDEVSVACQDDLHGRCCSAVCRCACHVLFGANDDL